MSAPLYARSRDRPALIRLPRRYCPGYRGDVKGRGSTAPHRVLFSSGGGHAIAGSMIGASHYRIGGDRLAAGAGRFVADVRAPGMLHAAVLRSRHAHARLVGIDAKRALELPGVRAVLTAADVPEAAVIPNRVGAPPGTERYLQP